LLRYRAYRPGNATTVRIGGWPYSDAQMSIFVRTREITSSVNSAVPAWPPSWGVHPPVAVAYRVAS
jgi:hypothetical protein